MSLAGSTAVGVLNPSLITVTLPLFPLMVMTEILPLPFSSKRSLRCFLRFQMRQHHQYHFVLCGAFQLNVTHLDLLFCSSELSGTHWLRKPWRESIGLLRPNQKCRMIVFASLCGRIGEAILGRPLFPLLQIKCSFENICSNRKSVRPADCFLHSLNVIPERGISVHLLDRCYKILWRRLVRGDDNPTFLFAILAATPG